MRLLGLLCCLLVALVAPACTALAEEDATQSASARVLFEEGVRLADAAQWGDAAERFRRALALRESPVIRYNLAAALLELGRVVEASEMLRQVQRAEGIDASLREQAEQQLAIATDRTAKLTIHLTGDAAGVQVSLDARTLPEALLDVTIPVDPGAHTIVVQRHGAQTDLRELQLGEGAQETVTLRTSRVPSAAEAARAAVPPPDASHRQEDKGPMPRRTKWMWWGIGGGVVVVAVAVVAGVLAARGSEPQAAYHGDFEPGSVDVQVAR